jgi:hypothetical protein
MLGQIIAGPVADALCSPQGPERLHLTEEESPESGEINEKRIWLTGIR